MRLTGFGLRSSWFIYGVPFTIILVALAVGFSSFAREYPELAIGVTYDLVVSAPLVYLLLIWKTEIPKITAVPFFTGGFFLASLVIPDEQQFHLNILKFWLVPAIGLGTVGWAVFKTRKAFVKYQALKRGTPDAFDFIKRMSADLVENLSQLFVVNRLRLFTGRKPIRFDWYSNALAFEAAAIYYGFASWRGFVKSEGHFSYHKKNGLLWLFSVIIFLVTAETIVLHFLLARWNTIAAWLITVPSIYFVLQLFAHLKAARARPIEIANEKLIVRYGLAGDSKINLDNIEKIELKTSLDGDEKDVKHVALLRGLEQFNTVIRLKYPVVFEGLYGVGSEYKTLLLFVDENARLKEMIERRYNR